jgi:predicted SAM-dependent methyltransferase
MRLLSQVPGSVLWLMSRGTTAQANLRKESQKRGVDPGRLIFASRVPLVEDHLARYRQADLFLDTHPYNAHTTAADALMAGLPVITFMGGSFPSRVAASLLHAAEMPELVASSLASYESLALRLAQDANALRVVRERLASKRRSCALFNTELFCRNLENAFIAIYSDSGGIASFAATSALAVRKLHIGGQQGGNGWELFSGDTADYPDNSFDLIYSCHTLQRLDYQNTLQMMLIDLHRILKPGGQLHISVPDLAALAGLINMEGISRSDRFHVMRMLFGGHLHPDDYNHAGLSHDILQDYLDKAGFEQVIGVAPFTHFPDASAMQFAGTFISLNIQARKKL